MVTIWLQSNPYRPEEFNGNVLQHVLSCRILTAIPDGTSVIHPTQVLGSLRLEKIAGGRLAFIGHAEKGRKKTRNYDKGRSVPFRCSLEVAWDIAAGGVFVRQFGADRHEKFPR